ncbi:MAG TPA: YggT family protein [Actinomycetota bacterium]|nr:YggT family protein [Actinomycetota bacterium]
MGLLCLLLYAYGVVLFIRFILSWATMVWSPPPSMAPVVRVIYDLTEPVLGLFRRYIPPVGGLDLSFLVVVIILQVVAASICG